MVGLGKVRASGARLGLLSVGNCFGPCGERIPQAIDTLTLGVTIRRARCDVWPWLVQMGHRSSRGGLHVATICVQNSRR